MRWFDLLFYPLLTVALSASLAGAMEPVTLLQPPQGAGASCTTAPDTPGMPVRCVITGNGPGQVTAATAVAQPGNESLAVERTRGIPAEDQTAVFLMIDRSDPRRADTVARIVRDLKRAVAAKGANQRVAVYSFASEFERHVGFTADPAVTDQALGEIAADGQATELFRLAGEAVKQFAGTQSDNKVLVIASDGKAEDQVYMSPEIVAAAREANVRIVGLGYPERPSQTPALQTLRRLAEETGGLFLAANAETRDLPAGDAETLFLRLANTSSLEIAAPSTTGTAQVTVSFSLDGGTTSFTYEMAAAAPAERPQTEAAPAGTAGTQTPAGPFEDVNLILIILGAAIAAIVLFLIVLFVAIGSRTRKSLQRQETPENRKFAPQKPLAAGAGPARPAPPPVPPAAAAAPLPNIVKPDSHHGMVLRFSDPKLGDVVVEGDEVRIGRHSTDDIVLDDTAVSRQHVLISKNPHGRYEILNRQAERDRPNPVYVNGVETVRSEIRDGDVIRIGAGPTEFTFLERHRV